MSLCLIVDDSKVVRKLARRMVEPMGFTVEEAEHGEDALGKCKQTMPNFILLDWHMPVMNGLEFLKNFRALTGNEATKVIFCTTETDLANIVQAMEAGANEYVMKPFNEAILKDKMTQIGLL
jgi:two-component system, chemotaxis family, chemotaxis protein CheY